jgi:lipopolysaccharide biosynthesis regulator YciM
MINADHAVIFSAYLSRVSIEDLEKIVEAQKNCARAALNSNTISQLDAQTKRTAVVAESVEHLIQWDRDIIAQVVQNVMVGISE